MSSTVLVLALALIPPLAHLVFTKRDLRRKTLLIVNSVLIGIGIWAGIAVSWWIGTPVAFVGLVKMVSLYVSEPLRKKGVAERS